MNFDAEGVYADLDGFPSSTTGGNLVQGGDC